MQKTPRLRRAAKRKRSSTAHTRRMVDAPHICVKQTGGSLDAEAARFTRTAICRYDKYKKEQEKKVAAEKHCFHKQSLGVSEVATGESENKSALNVVISLVVRQT